MVGHGGLDGGESGAGGDDGGGSGEGEGAVRELVGGGGGGYIGAGEEREDMLVGEKGEWGDTGRGEWEIGGEIG